MKSYQIFGKLAQKQKRYRQKNKKELGNGKHFPALVLIRLREEGWGSLAKQQHSQYEVITKSTVHIEFCFFPDPFRFLPFSQFPSNSINAL